MKTMLSSLLQNRITGASLLLLITMTVALGQSVHELSVKQPPPCGQPCSVTNPCKLSACPVCKVSTTGGHCAI